MFKNVHCKLRDITSRKEERQKNKWKNDFKDSPLSKF